MKNKKERKTRFGSFPHEADNKMKPKIPLTGVYDDDNPWYAQVEYIRGGCKR